MKTKIGDGIGDVPAERHGPDGDCPYFPCHYPGQDCTLCYCPFYPCRDERFGEWIESKKLGKAWSCLHCVLPHKAGAVDDVISLRDEMGERDLFDLIAERHGPKGKAVMVLGATSDAGKSVVCAALCRMLSRRGWAVIPYKSQNMSLNSRVLRGGREVSMIQELQSRAAGVRTPPHQINPILMKPLGDSTSAVYVNGEPVGTYGVTEYYGDFVPNEGRAALAESLSFLKSRYDFIVMEGAGSPAEINIYDVDLANMGAANEADADCILVVNAEWGGSFAYAAGTVALIPEKDRRRIRGVVINNVRGSTRGLVEGGKILEKITGVPFLGAIPHIELDLPKEDSECFRGAKRFGRGKTTVAVVRYPRISNFTDFDPLPFEDVTVVLADAADEISVADAVILPGSKNPASDLEWMVGRGIDRALRGMVGKVPILGIGGGYAMLGKNFGAHGGLGIVDVAFDTDNPRPSAKVSAKYGELPVEGYSVSPSAEPHGGNGLFSLKGGAWEGYHDPDWMVMGTEINGIFDLPGFRDAFLRMIEGFDSPTTGVNHGDRVEASLDALADAVEGSLDLDILNGIFGGSVF
ncbi:MAG: cobyric acid synthase [Thermoplasmatales archaeon]|nr:cobyric acid synthase [Thermoplasmatales archaeon]